MSMQQWYHRYLQGSYQEVYDELLAMQGHVFDAPIDEDSLLSSLVLRAFQPVALPV